jgi:hypothetical protein
MALNSDQVAIDAVLNMAPNDLKIESLLPSEVPEDLPLPSDLKVVVLPFVFAIVLKLLLQPALRILERLHIPRTVASLLLILALFVTIVGLGTVIFGPARTWAAKLPDGIPRLQDRLNFMRKPIDTLQRFLQQVEDFGGTGPLPNAATLEQGPTLLSKLFTGARNFASGLFTTVLFLFFFSCLAISSCIASSRYCRALGANARSWKSRSKLKVMSPHIWSRSRS